MLLPQCLIVVLLVASDLASIVRAAEGPNEWLRTVDAAKKEGTVVFATAADVELRRQLEPALKRRFGISLEYAPGRAAEQSAKIIQEGKAGVRSYDVFAFGGCGGMSLIRQDVLEPLEPVLMLPEVKDAKNWWGGFIWADNINSNKYFFSFTANSGSANRWYNFDLYNGNEFRSYDDLLNPKLKGKIGFLDPQYPGRGAGVMDVFVGEQRRRVPKKTCTTGTFCYRQRPANGGSAGEGKDRYLYRLQPPQRRAVH